MSKYQEICECKYHRKNHNACGGSSVICDCRLERYKARQKVVTTKEKPCKCHCHHEFDVDCDCFGTTDQDKCLHCQAEPMKCGCHYQCACNKGACNCYSLEPMKSVAGDINVTHKSVEEFIDKWGGRLLPNYQNNNSNLEMRKDLSQLFLSEMMDLIGSDEEADIFELEQEEFFKREGKNNLRQELRQRVKQKVGDGE